VAARHLLTFARPQGADEDDDDDDDEFEDARPGVVITEVEEGAVAADRSVRRASTPVPVCCSGGAAAQSKERVPVVEGMRKCSPVV
jgi:hypothetical protein